MMKLLSFLSYLTLYFVSCVLINSWFKLHFLHLACREMLILKSNVELVCSIILKERRFCESKHVILQFKHLKIYKFSLFLDLGFKITCFTNVA